MHHFLAQVLCPAAWWLASLLALALPLRGQQLANLIQLTQVGFYPAAPKLAVVVGTGEGMFEVTTPDQKTMVFWG